MNRKEHAVVRRISPFQQSPFSRPFAEDPIIYVDIGARGGFEPEMKALAFCTDAIGFEPAPAEYARLQKDGNGPWHGRLILPHAVGGSNAKRLLHIPKDPVAASLLAVEPQTCAPFGRDTFFNPVETIEVETLTLPDALATADVAAVDYLKIDAEGAEFEILAAADILVRGLCALKIEVAFLPLRQGHPLACDLESHLRQRGFQLFDVIGAAHWRDTGNVIHPFIDDLPVPYSRGQLVHGDFLFFRTAESLDFSSDSGRLQVHKTAFIAMAFGFFDYALRLLHDDRMKSYLAGIAVSDPVPLVGQLSSAAGQAAYRAALMRHLRGVWTYLRRLPQAFGTG